MDASFRLKNIFSEDDALGTRTDENGTETSKSNDYKCACGKRYVYRQGIHKHKQTCTYEPPREAEQQNQIVSIATPDQIEMLLRENKELRVLLAEQSTQMVNMVKSIADVAKVAGNNNTISTNCHNTNINFYLKEGVYYDDWKVNCV